MDPAAPSGTAQQVVEGGGTVTLAQERVLPSTINGLFQKHGVPRNLDCLVIDIDGLDYWVWEALSAEYSPTLVVVEYNVHAGPDIKASIRCDESWSYRRTKDYGASFAALVGLADAKGYRLIHVHGPWNLYFLKKDCPWPAELAVRMPLDAEAFAVLTDTVGFYDALCQGRRPSWIDAPPPDLSRSPWQIIGPSAPSLTSDIEGVPLQVLAGMHDVQWYQQRKVYEEKVSLLYQLLQREGFANLVDVGANVGMIPVFARRVMPQLRVVCAEADPRLVKLLRHNLAHHGIDDAIVVNAIVGSRCLPSATFSINPTSTLDNRVRVEAWDQVHVPMVSMDSVLLPLAWPGPSFIKIDTQGFELGVLQGLEGFLASRSDWLLKMEFAPDWLRSQGTDPLDLLSYLQERYQFAEFAERIPYGLTTVDQLFAYPVAPADHAAFVDHVVSLNRGGLGWVDLIVRPRPGSHAVALDRTADPFQDLPLPRLEAMAREERYVHAMCLPGVTTGTSVYGADLPLNYHRFPLFQYLNELSTSGAVCLDIGTYDGMSAFSLAARGALRVDATCQFDLRRFRVARALGGWKNIAYFPHTDLARMRHEFAEGQYDLVVMSAMLHHLLSPLEGLLEARRLSKPRGWLLLEVVVRPGHAAEVSFNAAVDDAVRGQPTIWVPSPEAALAMLRFAGFTVCSHTLLVGTKTAHETNHDRLTVLARAVPPDEIEGRTKALEALHDKIRQLGAYTLAPAVAAEAVASTVPYHGPDGARTLNPWFERPLDPLQPEWTDPRPARATLFRMADNADFARLAGKHPDGAFDESDLRHLPSRYPGQSMPDGMRWGLKQLGNLHVLDHVKAWGLADVLEIGPGFNLYFANHLPPWCRYTGLDADGFYPGPLLADADANRRGRRVNGLLGKANHGLAVGSFDACISVSVLEHVAADDMPDLCREMFALLRPGGWALHSIDVDPRVAMEVGSRWLTALRGAGFLLDGPLPDLDASRLPTVFTEPLSITQTFYFGFKSNVWGNDTLRALANPVSILVAMRKPV